MNIETIIKEYAERYGYDGLYSPDYDCACAIDNIGGCGNIYLDCEVGYKNDCESCTKKADCDNRIDGTDFMVSDVKCWEGAENDN